MAKCKGNRSTCTVLTIARNGQEMYVENWKPWAKYATFEALWCPMTLKWFGVPSPKYKAICRKAQNMWDVSQWNSPFPIVVLMFILVQTPELCADFWYKYSDLLCVHTQPCEHLHMSLAHWCILQHIYPFNVYCQDSWQILAFCSCVIFP